MYSQKKSEEGVAFTSERSPYNGKLQNTHILSRWRPLNIFKRHRKLQARQLLEKRRKHDLQLAPRQRFRHATMLTPPISHCLVTIFSPPAFLLADETQDVESLRVGKYVFIATSGLSSRNDTLAGFDALAGELDVYFGYAARCHR